MYTDTEGIILRQVKATGGRRMVSVFTKNYGKISVGTNLNERSNKTRAALAIRPFTYGRYELFKNRDYYNLNGAETVKSFYAFGEDIEKFTLASYALELTDKVLLEENPQPRLFNILIDFLNALEKRKGSYETLLLAYMVKLLKELGFLPELNRSCVDCGKDFTAAGGQENGKGRAPFFSIASNGPLCADCAAAEKNGKPEVKGRLIYPINFDIIGVIVFFADKPIASLEKVALKQEDAGLLMRILKEYFSYHLEVSNLKSESLMIY